MRQLNDKMTEGRLRWYSPVRRDEGYIGQRMLHMEMSGRRGRGRPRRFVDAVKEVRKVARVRHLREKQVEKGYIK